MKYNSISVFCFATVLAATAILTGGCGGDVKEIEDIPQDEKIVTENTNLFRIDNKIFHFQNPVQSALLMKNLAVPFDGSALNDPKNVGNYSTSFKQAVNIGVFGTDLGYITANGKNQEAITHLAAIKKLAEALDVSSSFDFGQMEKFGNNVGNQQEMLAITTTAYKGCEEFLTNEDRHDMAGLIMAGAMIEGLHFAVSYAKAENNKEVIERMADEIRSLDNIILVLNPHYSKETAKDLSDLVDQLVELQTSFKALKVTYVFKESEVDKEKKTCTIKSETDYSMDPKALDNVSKIIKSIRDSIIS